MYRQADTPRQISTRSMVAAFNPLEEAMKLGVAALWLALLLLGFWSLVASPAAVEGADAAPAYVPAIADFTARR